MRYNEMKLLWKYQYYSETEIFISLFVENRAAVAVAADFLHEHSAGDLFAINDKS